MRNRVGTVQLENHIGESTHRLDRACVTCSTVRQQLAGIVLAYQQKVTLALVTGSTHGCTILHNAEKADGGSITKKWPCMCESSIPPATGYLHHVSQPRHAVYVPNQRPTALEQLLIGRAS